MSITNLDANLLTNLHKAACTWLGVEPDGPNHVIIAGGALRDMWLGKRLYNVKDIDVFTTAPLNENAWYKHLDDGTEYDAIEWLKFLGQTNENIGGLTFNFVHFDPEYALFNSRTVIEGFDFSICQIAFDGHAVEMTPLFMQDIENKVLRRVNETLGTQSHGQRMMEKFPDWEFIDFTKPAVAQCFRHLLPEMKWQNT